MRRNIAILLVLLAASFAAVRVYAQQATARGGTIVNVGPAAAVTVNVSPPTGTIAAGGATLNITATLVNDFANKGVNWTLSGAGCTGSACGGVAPTFSRTGQAVVFTSPGSLPSPPVVTVTATSIQDTSKFDTILITLTTAPTSPVVVNNFSTPQAVLTSAATNSVLITPSVGTFIEVTTADTLGNLVTGVTACSPANVCTALTAACTAQGACNGTAPGHGSMRKFFGIGLPSGLDHVVVSNSPATGSLDIGVLDASNLVAFDSAAVTIGTTNPTGVLGPGVTPAGTGLVTAGLAATGAVTGASAPFIFKGTAFGDGVAYQFNNVAGLSQPNWLQTGTPWGITAAYIGGTVTPVVSVAVVPTSASVVTSTTKAFSANVTNDSRGVTWTLTGAGCSGATCGTISSSSSGSGVAITYTAPSSVPSPATVSLKATSVGDTTKTATATITITTAPAIGVSVAPSTRTVTAGSTGTFVATVTNDGSNAGVDWTIAGTANTRLFAFNANQSNYTDPTQWPTVSFKNTRLWDTGVTWRDIELSAGVYTYTLLDSEISTAISHGVTEIIYTEGKTPSFYGGGVDGAGPTSNMSAFTAFVIAIATHITSTFPSITLYWEHRNEPNLASFWNGTAAQLVTMTRASYAVLHPMGIQVLSPAGSGGTAIGSFILSYLTTCAGTYPFDIFAYHAYLGDGNPDPTNGLNLIINDIKVKKSSGFPGLSAMETWFTEGSWSTSAAYSPLMTDAQKANYLNTMYSKFNASSNVQPFIKIFDWYAWNNSHDFGVLATGTPPVANLAGLAFGALGCTGATCGTVSPTHSASGATVTYTAPAGVPSPPTVTLIAASTTNPTKTGTATITIVPAAVQVSVAPSSASVQAGGNKQNFTATVLNSASGVNWTVSCGSQTCGTVAPASTASGVAMVYTSPTTAPNPSTVTLTATSIQDGTKTATASITVQGTAGPFHCTQPNCPAFPEAQGGGAAAQGGRGGVIFVVNDLSDTTHSGCQADGVGTCSLRDCIQSSAHRTCVFTVSGTITFKSRAQISNPYITIAGQTAPGGGIVIGGSGQVGEQFFITTHDVIIRYLTYDGFSNNSATGPDSGTVCCEMASGNIFNVMWDHISTRWTGNKAFPIVSNDAGSVHNVSLQWILMYESNACHPVGYGTLYVSNEAPTDLATTDNDVHHSMFVNIDHRMPLNQSGLNTRVVNTINYNWGQFAVLSMGGIHGDFISNKYVDGTADPSGLRTIVCPGNCNNPPGFCTYSNGNALNYQNVHTFLGEVGNNPNDSTGNPGGNNEGPPSFYLLNNSGRVSSTYLGPVNTPSNTPNSSDQTSMASQGGEGFDNNTPMPGSWFRSTPNPTLQYPIKADPVSSIDSVVPPIVGNSQALNCDGSWRSIRNTQDQRIIAQYMNRSPGNSYGGQFSPPAVPSGTACTWSNRLPTAWRARYSIPSTVSGSDTDPVTGLTFGENYLDGLVP